jgi:hypothetical protein
MTPERALFPELRDNQRGLMPEGFRYEEDIISEADEAALAKSLATLDLKPFEFHGHLGNRRVTSFGLRYDYARRTVKVTDGFHCAHTSNPTECKYRSRACSRHAP